jgi:hypothetical protein
VDLFSEPQVQNNFRMSREVFEFSQGRVRVTRTYQEAELPINQLKRDLLTVIWLLATPVQVSLQFFLFRTFERFANKCFNLDCHFPFQVNQ